MEGGSRSSPPKKLHGPATPTCALCWHSCDRGGQSPGSQQDSPRGQRPSQQTETLLWAASALSWDLDAGGLGVKQREAGKSLPGSCPAGSFFWGVKGNRDSEIAWSPQPGSQELRRERMPTQVFRITPSSLALSWAAFSKKTQAV